MSIKSHSGVYQKLSQEDFYKNFMTESVHESKIFVYQKYWSKIG